MGLRRRQALHAAVAAHHEPAAAAIEVEWEPPPPAQILARRQIVENIPDPCTPLFDEMYLWVGLETGKDGNPRKSIMEGGGPMFISMHGYAYQRFDWPFIIQARKERITEAMTEAELDAAEIKADAEEAEAEGYADRATRAGKKLTERMKGGAIPSHRPGAAQQIEMAEHDMGLFLDSLSDEDRSAYEDWAASSGINDPTALVTRPESQNPTFGAFNRTQVNENQIKDFYDWAKPMILATREKWEQVDAAEASDEQLLTGIRELAIAGGSFWSGNGGHTFGVAKSTDDQLQAFLREALPDHHFTSGQFLSGFKGKTMEANEPRPPVHDREPDSRG